MLSLISPRAQSPVMKLWGESESKESNKAANIKVPWAITSPLSYVTDAFENSLLPNVKWCWCNTQSQHARRSNLGLQETITFISG